MFIMPVHLPAEVSGGSFVDRSCSRRKIRGYMMLEAVLADITQQFLHLWNLNHACPAEGMQRIVGKRTLTDIARDLPGKVVGGEASEAHCSSLYCSIQCAVRILFANGSGDDLLEVHFHALIEEVFRQIRAVKAHRLVRVVPVVVVPIQQSARRFAGQRQCIHA